MKTKLLIAAVSFLLFACMATPTGDTPDTPAAPTATVMAATLNATVAATPTMDGPTIANCPMFPANNIWNARVDSLPTHPQSEAWINSIGRDEGFHMDFGSGEWDGGPIGIPYNVLSGSSVTKYTFDFYYPDES